MSAPADTGASLDTASPLGALRIDRGANAPKPTARKWRLRWIVAALIVIAIGLFVWRAGRAPQTVEFGTVASASVAQSITTLNATGRVVAQRRAAVSTKATGRLEWLGVQEGQAVKAGEVLARLESFDVAASREQAAAGVRQARANLEQGVAELDDAKLNLARQQDLLRQNFVSASAVDTALARYAKARAALSGYQAAIGVAEANLKSSAVSVEQTLIRAPFDGVVLTKNGNVGDIITPFSSATGSIGAVVTMADMSTLEVEADVSESSISKIAVDGPAEIQLDAYPDLHLSGKVSRIVPTVDRSKATLVVKVTFVERDPRVLPDMSAKIAFLSRPLRADERAPVVAVATSAIVKRAAGETASHVVFVVGADNKVKQTPVTTGIKLGELTEIRGTDNGAPALKPGDRVVLAPSDKLHNGGSVEAAKK